MGGRMQAHKTLDHSLLTALGSVDNGYVARSAPHSASLLEVGAGQEKPDQIKKWEKATAEDEKEKVKHLAKLGVWTLQKRSNLGMHRMETYCKRSTRQHQQCSFHRYQTTL